MTISTTNSTQNFQGNGATTVFSFDFVGAFASDITIIYTDTTGATYTLNPSQYTLSLNAPATGQIWGVGGTLTYPLSGSPIASGTSITISRSVPDTQTVSISNQGNFYPNTVEQALDLLCMQIQQIANATEYSITAPISDVDPELVLPSAGARALKILGFDVNGNVTVFPGGTSANFIPGNNINTDYTGQAYTIGIMTPGGRLTIDAGGNAVQLADVTNASVISYTPFVHNWCPVFGFNGSNAWQIFPILFNNFTLNPSFHASQAIYDIFAYPIGFGTGGYEINLITGPAWTNSTTRSAAITQLVTSSSDLLGPWVNGATMTAYSSDLGHTISIPAFGATYLGSFFCTATAATSAQFKISGANGGSNPFMGLFNAYNRVRATVLERDSNTAWTYATNGWREQDNNAHNRVTFLDGLGQVPTRAKLFNQVATPGGTGHGAQTGVLFNAISGTPSVPATAYCGDTIGFYALSVEESFYPVLGLNFIQAMENAPNNASVTFNTNGGMHALLVDLEY